VFGLVSLDLKRYHCVPTSSLVQFVLMFICVVAMQFVHSSEVMFSHCWLLLYCSHTVMSGAVVSVGMFVVYVQFSPHPLLLCVVESLAKGFISTCMVWLLESVGLYVVFPLKFRLKL